MLSIEQKDSPVTIIQPPLERESSQENNVPAIWSQRQITQLPRNVLFHIFSCLECDDIAQVNNTCKTFRKVVREEYPDALFYSQLPERFRKLYPQSLSWQKRMVRSGQHPFATKLPSIEKNCFNFEQHAAFLCFRTLRKMMSAPWYLPVEVFTTACDTIGIRMDCTLNSSHLLLFYGLDHLASMLGPDESGSWSEQAVELDRSGNKMLQGLHMAMYGGLYTNLGSQHVIEHFKRDFDHGRCQLTNQSWVSDSYDYVVSPSGKYLAFYEPHATSIMGIRCLDDQGQWVPMRVVKIAGNVGRIASLRFSTSGRLLALAYKKELVIMSPDSQGCWNPLWRNRCENDTIFLIEFCPSESWLLVGFSLHFPFKSFKHKMIRLDPAGKCLSIQTILTLAYLTFSPAGNYLVHRLPNCVYPLLRHSPETGKWLFFGNLADPEAGESPLGQTISYTDIVILSPCDNYLLISSKDGTVEIWRQNEQGRWKLRGWEKQDGKVIYAEFSQSSIHAVTVDKSSIRIWGRDERGSWRVKALMPAPGIRSAHFHPVAEHLMLLLNNNGVSVREIRKDCSGEKASRLRHETTV